MDALIIMTKVPVPDKTKTRLMDVYSGRECAELQECFLKDIFAMCGELKGKLDIFVTYTPEFEASGLIAGTPDYIELFPQEGEELGARMRNSIGHVLGKGYGKVVLIGSDIPEVKAAAVLRAFENLSTKDVCIGPTFDGGYYLLGMKNPHNELFEPGISWGTETVFESTVRRAEESGLSVSVEESCRDIDTKEDIRELMSQPRSTVPGNTLGYIESNWRGCFGERPVESLLQEVSEECMECRACMKNCRLLCEHVGSPKKFASDIREGKVVDDIVPFSCNLCSKCEHYCPKDLNLGEVFMGMRREIIGANNGTSPLKGHKGVYAYQSMASSKLMSGRSAAGSCSGAAKRVFLPGCSLPAYGPGLVKQTLKYLQEGLGGTEMVLQCCGSPAKLIGDEALFEEKYRLLTDMIDEMGAAEVITACQNCYILIKKKSPQYNVRSLWEVMAELGLPGGAENKGEGSDIEFTIHDSCPTRYETGIHDSVRKIVGSLGYRVKESEHSREKTSCCGAGGMISSVNPEMARKVAEEAAGKMESEHVIAYCASCREAMAGAGKRSVHILDLVFGERWDSRSKFRTAPERRIMKWLNRWKVKNI